MTSDLTKPTLTSEYGSGGDGSRWVKIQGAELVPQPLPNWDSDVMDWGHNTAWG